MDLPTYFDDFRIKTQPTDRQRKVMTDEHIKLRELLSKADELKDILLGTFIQGSQRRATSLIGSADHPCDVDVVAVTNLPRSTYTAAYAHKLFQPFLERHYSKNYTAQDRSWCIQVDDEVTLDLVPTSEPDSPQLKEAVRSAKALRDWSPTFESLSEMVTAEAKESADWDRSEPLWIPDRTLMKWERTHPLYLIAWTVKKNKACNGHFSHVVKAVKWWKREMKSDPKYPKGYPLEHLVADACPDGLTTVADGLTRTLESIASQYRVHASRRETPFLQARGIPERQNVLQRVDGSDFAAFHVNVEEAARLARAALDHPDISGSAALWRRLLGTEFPAPPSAPTGGFTPRDKPTSLSPSRYA
ncbi:MAG: hypothetical protein IT436_13955 [Phycisphaerales bacterium]|nr:hypothetical protein [Phycisphaerales bacterium]